MCVGGSLGDTHQTSPSLVYLCPRALRLPDGAACSSHDASRHQQPVAWQGWCLTVERVSRLQSSVAAVHPAPGAGRCAPSSAARAAPSPPTQQEHASIGCYSTYRAAVSRRRVYNNTGEQSMVAHRMCLCMPFVREGGEKASEQRGTVTRVQLLASPNCIRRLALRVAGSIMIRYDIYHCHCLP